jgi:hypothetical protein
MVGVQKFAGMATAKPQNLKMKCTAHSAAHPESGNFTARVPIQQRRCAEMNRTPGRLCKYAAQNAITNTWVFG